MVTGFPRYSSKADQYITPEMIDRVRYNSFRSELAFLHDEIDELKAELEEIELKDSPVINGHKINKPIHFKNKAQHRAYYIAMALAQKKPISAYTLRMGDEVIIQTFPIIMTSSDCIEIIMFEVPPEIELDYNAKNPSKSAREAMEYVPAFFEPDVVIYDHKTKPKKIYFLEIKIPANERVRTSSFIERQEE